MVFAVTFALLALFSPLQSAAQATSDPQARLAAGKLEEAREGFEAALTADPRNAAALRGEAAVSERLALAARAQHDDKLALEALLRGQKFVPGDVELLTDTGILEEQMKLPWDADAVLARAHALAPNELKVLYAMARVKLDLGQIGPAEEEMRAYLKLKPEDATAHYGLGHILQVAQRPEEAKAELERSIALQPQQSESYYQLGQIALDAGQYDAARAQFAKTLARNPRHGGALAGTGIAYFRQKQYDKAAQSLEQAVADAPEYQPGHYYLGLTLARLGRKAESDRELAVATRMADEQNTAAAQRNRIQP